MSLFGEGPRGSAVAGAQDTATSAVALFARIALGAGFLSAVADRFGLWGAVGASGVAWGDFERFTAYTATLLGPVPTSWVPLFAVAATVAEIALGLLLWVGYRTRLAGLFSGVLLMAFALAMTFAGGVKDPLDSSVFSAAAGGLLLALVGGGRWSFDGRVGRP